MVSDYQYPEMKATLRNQEFLVNFTNLLGRSGLFEKQIEVAIFILGKFVQVQRVYIFESEHSGKIMRNTYEWCDTRVESLKSQYPVVHFKMNIAKLKGKLLKDGQFLAHDLGGIQNSVCKLMKSRQTKTILLLPIYIRNEMHGFLGLDSCNSIRSWNDMEIGFLRTVVTTLSGAFELHNKEVEKESSEKKFQNLFEMSSDAILIFNQFGRILEVNEKVSAILEIPKAKLLASNIQTFLIPDDSQKLASSTIFEKEIKTASGQLLPVEVSSSALIYSGKPATMWVIRNISERKQVERQILAAIIQAEERERGRLARDLHDSLGPMLSSMKLFSKVLDNHPDESKKKEMLGYINEALDESVLLIKEISNNLSPQVLNDFGLASAIQAFCKRISLTKSIDIRFDSNVFDIRFEPNTEAIIFRVLKELINNTIKHASASQIEIFLIRTAPELTLMYSDNGVGFDFQKVLANNTSGMGVANIVNQIKSINGKILVEQQTQTGFSLKMVVDLN
jgi:PAS domain S-box-containing protein